MQRGERGRECVNVVLICRAIKRVKGSRWAASIPSVSANELARFTAPIHTHTQAASSSGDWIQRATTITRNNVLIEQQMGHNPNPLLVEMME